MTKRGDRTVNGMQAAGGPFGARLRRVRREAGFSQEALAEASGVSAKTISELESGRRAVPQPESARLLAEALGLEGASREAFFGDVRRSRAARMAAARDLDPARDAAPELPIIGREADIAAIERCFSGGARLVTLIGPGGVGKTRIARAAAGRFAAAGEPALWVPLEAVTSAALVLPAIARAADAPARGAEPPLGTLRRAFATRPPLLVLDNAEHLLAAAPEIAALLDAAPDLRILATSREALRIAPERLIRVEPLPLPHPADDRDDAALAENPAVALFMRSLAVSAPEPMVQAASLDAAASVVRLLDGLPLAIELAAAQGATLPLASIVTLLETSGIATLGRGRRDGTARFQTMDSAIGWSIDLLPPDGQRLFRMLGIFRGGFTTEAVIGVTGATGEPALVAALPLLADAHLIVFEPAGSGARFRMLEPVRMAAIDRLGLAGEAPAARTAHAAWFLAWAQQQGRLVAGPDPLPALDALDADLANVLAALEWSSTAGTGDPPVAAALRTAAALSQYWEVRARFQEGRAALAAAIEAALDGGCQEDPCQQALLEALFYAGYLAYTQGDALDLETAVERLRPRAQAGASSEYRARLGILDVLLNEARGVPADRLLAEVRETFGLVADGPQGISWFISRQLLANLLGECGDPEGAVPHLQAIEAWAVRRREGIHRRAVTSWLGWVLLQLGRQDEARRCFADSLDGSADGRVMTLAWSLLGAAIAVSGPGANDQDLARAARLHGAFDAEAARYGFWLSATQSRLSAESHDRIVARLGSDRAATLRAEGIALPTDALLALASTLPVAFPA